MGAIVFALPVAMILAAFLIVLIDHRAFGFPKNNLLAIAHAAIFFGTPAWLIPSCWLWDKVHHPDLPFVRRLISWILLCCLVMAFVVIGPFFLMILIAKL